MSSKMTWEHFRLCSFWTVAHDTKKYKNSSEPMYIIDSQTGDRYFNEDTDVIRFKCALLTFGTPIVHTLAAIAHIAYNLIKLLSFYHFWKTLDNNNYENPEYNLKQRSLDAGEDLFHILFAPINILLLEFAALYGIIMPHDGRKLYASLERFAFDDSVLAPCFQPDPQEHLFGGDITVQNTF